MRVTKYDVIALLALFSVFVVVAFFVGKNISEEKNNDRCVVSVSVTETVITENGKVLTTRTYCPEIKRVSTNA